MQSQPDQRVTRVLRGVLDACLLALVLERDRYGYELAEALHKRGLHQVAEGSIYPLLRRLEQRGLLESYTMPGTGNAPPRRYYRATPEGGDVLSAASASWRTVRDGVNAILDREETYG